MVTHSLSRRTQEIPFLHFLLEVSGEAPPPVQEDKRSGTKTPPASSPSAYSTFLCLQLAGEDASPLFEIACRALFRLRPQELPRFVERLARFRAYANEIKREGCAEGAAGEGAGPLPPQDSGGDEEDDEKEKHEEGGEEQEQTRPSSLQSGRPGTSVSSSADARSERTSGEDTALSEEQQRQQHQNQRSPSPPPPQSSVASRRASEDDASEHGGRDSWSTTRPSSSVPSTEHSSEPPPPSPALAAPAPAANEPPPPPSGAADNLPDPVTGSPSEAREHPEERSRSRDTAPVAPAYFARALASLPPAVEDDGAADAGSRQRRARLSLLLGACRFAEACRLLRSRAWEGAGTVPGGKRGSWRDDRGGEEAWRAAMRLLNELRRAVVAVTDKGREDAAASAASAAAAAAAAASGAGTTAAAPGGDDDGDDDDAAATMAGGGAPLALQFRLAFEDALAETILADSPERMEAVMLCRPDGLTPVAVVRMVRRAAARAAAERSSVAGAAARNGGGGGGNETDARKQFVPGSTQTLKMCLLLLLEDGAGQEFPAV